MPKRHSNDKNWIASPTNRLAMTVHIYVIVSDSETLQKKAIKIEQN